MKLFAILTFVCAVAGCGTVGAPSMVTRVKPPTAAIAINGHYKGKIESKASDDHPAAKMAEAMVSMMMPSLDVQGNRFTMTMMGMPMSGDLRRRGDDLTFTVTEFMGLPAEEFKQLKTDSAKSDLDKPMKGKIVKGGKQILIEDAEDKSQVMVFERAERTNDSESAGVRSVSAREEQVVGSWGADPRDTNLAGQGVTDAERKMIRSMLERMRLDLRHDNTFTLDMGIQLKGTWSRAKDELRLQTTGIVGMDMPEGKLSGDDIVVKVEDGRLRILSDKDGTPEVTLVRSN